MIRVGERLELDRPLARVAGRRPCVGAPGVLYEIRERRLNPLPLPHPDCVPLAIDDDGRLIAGRTSGDRAVRRYRGNSLDGTYPFRLEEILSLAVAGNRVVVVRADGSALGLDEQTVPRVDYAYRFGRRFSFVDALGDRVAFAGEGVVVCDFEGRVRRRARGAVRVRLREEEYWRIEEGLRCGRKAVRPTSLGLSRIDDVVVGVEEWAIGEALVRFEVGRG